MFVSFFFIQESKDIPTIQIFLWITLLKGQLWFIFLSRQDIKGVGQKNQRGQIQPERCSSRYIKGGVM